MAKKTNKTDHVLNLISNGNTKHTPEGSEESTGTQTPPPVDPLANNNPQVSIVQSSAKEERIVADTIRQSLEQELESKIPKQPQDAVAPEVPVKRDSVSEEAVKEEIATREKAEEELIMEEKNEQPNQHVEAKITDTADTDVYEDRFSKDLEARINEPAPEFTFVNVMEYLVRNNVVKYMKQFGNCTCNRCVEDTAALTLTHLPPKYVVVNKNAISPLLDYYGHKFAGQMTVEITKACMKVNKFPHHEK